MKDNEIIKALECCCTLNGVGCRNCPQYDIHSAMCVKNLIRNALDLINRQKSEIERLQKENEILSKNADTAFQDGLNEAQDLYALQIKNEIKSEAVKEFAEMYKTEVTKRYEDIAYQDLFFGVVDNLVKEMTEVNENDRA